MKEHKKEMVMFQGRRFLIVEDDSKELANMVALISKLGATSKEASSLEEARKSLAEEAFDYLLTDLHISTRAGHDRPDGLEVIKYASDMQPHLTIVANSFDLRSEIWDLAQKAGAHHFCRKPFFKMDELAIAFRIAKERKQHIPTPVGTSSPPQGLWCRYASLFPEKVVIDADTMKKVRGLARHPSTAVVMKGETGTGKEVLAQLMHSFRSEREGRPIPFVAVNCATISSGLAESLLFGHSKGAFTGAEKTTEGYIAKADGGILFLDEIHTLELSVQQKLLRVLNDGTYNRLGEVKVLRSRFQLIAASTKDLDTEVSRNKFLIDLRARMMGLDFSLKPLRERPEDIPPLTALYLSEKGISIDDNAFQKLCHKLEGYYWQGNIRQLFKALETWLVLSEIDGWELDADHFPVLPGMIEPESGKRISGPEGIKHISSVEDFNFTAENDVDLTQAVARFEKVMIQNALQRHRTASAVCRALNLPRSTFENKRAKYGI